MCFLCYILHGKRKYKPIKANYSERVERKATGLKTVNVYGSWATEVYGKHKNDHNSNRGSADPGFAGHGFVLQAENRVSDPDS